MWASPPPRQPHANGGSVWMDARFVVPIVGGLLLVFWVLPSPTTREHELMAATGHRNRHSGSSSGGGSGGQLRREVIAGQEALWQLPEAPAKGLLFLAHGCSHSATDFWERSEACPDCLGLPEEVRIRTAALRLGYAVVAVSSRDRRGARCWDVRRRGEESADGRGVARILTEIRQREGLDHAALYALGASSGGAFVLMLPQLAEVQGVVAQIMGVPQAMLQLPSGRRFPPTLFVHMPRDGSTAESVRQDVAALRAAGTPAADIQIKPRPVTAEFLSSHAPQIGPEMAAAVVEALRQGGMLDSKGMLTRNPRQATSEWHALLKKGVPGISKLSLQPDESPISELLNLAYAGHEIVSDHTAAALAWLEAGGEADIGELVRAEGRQQRGAGGWG